MATDQPIKLCECGCGQPAPIAKITSRRIGWIKGQPIRFIHNHHSRKRGNLWERIRSRCVIQGECWIWSGATNGRRGYGRTYHNHRWLYVHRVAYEYVHGPIPDGLELDHVKARGCTSPACCNPAHLEAVTHLVNMSRSPNALKTHCPRGHLLAEPNLVQAALLRGGRNCRQCNRERHQERRAREKKGTS